MTEKTKEFSSRRVDRGRVRSFAEFTQMMSVIDYAPTDRFSWFLTNRGLLNASEYTLHQFIYRDDYRGKCRHVFRTDPHDEALRDKIELLLNTLPPWRRDDGPQPTDH